MPRELTLKQRKFIDAYLGEANGNAAESARIAGYSEHYVQGHDNLRNPKIRAEIDRRLDDAVLKPAEVLARLSEMATADVADFLDVTAVAVLDLPRAKRAGKTRLVKSIEVGPLGVVKLKLHDSQKALVTLAKIHGLLSDPGAKPADADPADPDAAERALKAANETPARPRPDAPLGSGAD